MTGWHKFYAIIGQIWKQFYFDLTVSAHSIVVQRPLSCVCNFSSAQFLCHDTCQLLQNETKCCAIIRQFWKQFYFDLSDHLPGSTCHIPYPGLLGFKTTISRSAKFIWQDSCELLQNETDDRHHMPFMRHIWKQFHFDLTVLILSRVRSAILYPDLYKSCGCNFSSAKFLFLCHGHDTCQLLQNETKCCAIIRQFWNNFILIWPSLALAIIFIYPGLQSSRVCNCVILMDSRWLF